MNTEIIIYNECTNGGKELYLYENDKIGAVEAFGYSAYLAAQILKKPLMVYDDKVMLPCVVLRQNEVEMLKAVSTLDEYDNTDDYMILHLNEPEAYDTLGYETWVEQVKEDRRGSNRVARVMAKEANVGNMNLHENLTLLGALLIIGALMALVWFLER